MMYIKNSVTESLPLKDGKYFCYFNDEPKTAFFCTKEKKFYNARGKEFVTHWLDVVYDDHFDPGTHVETMQSIVDEFSDSRKSNLEAIIDSKKAVKMLFRLSYTFGSTKYMRHFAEIDRQLKKIK